MNCLIVEDQQNAYTHLKSLVDGHSSITFSGYASNLKDAKALLELKKPDLVFFDIELGDEISFNLLESLPTIDFEIIFTTAHNDFAVRAFKVNAIDYLLKPINPDEFNAAVARVVDRPKNTPNEDQISKLLEDVKTQQIEHIRVANNGTYEIIRLENIIGFEAADNYTKIKIWGKNDLLSSKNIKEYEQLLEETSFFRVHKKHLINLAFVEQFSKGISANVSLKDGTIIPIARRRKESFFDFLEHYSAVK